MMKGLNDAGIFLYFTCVNFIGTCKSKVKDFFEDEHGLSGVVVAVMLVLVAVLLIVAFWEVLSEWLGNMWKTISGEGSKVSPTSWGDAE